MGERMTKPEIVPQGAAPMAPAVAGMDVSEIIAKAVEAGTGVEAIEKLVDLQGRMMEQSAKKALFSALAGFRRECPPIKKTSSVRPTRGGGMTFRFASLDEIARTIQPFIDKYRLAYYWSSERTANGLKVTCHIMHEEGATHSASFEAPIDDGRMNQIQKVGSTQTYAQRYSLISALGLTTTDQDDDGNGATPAPVATLSEEQAANLDAMLDEIGNGERDRLLAYARDTWGADSVRAIPANQYAHLVGVLEKKRSAA